MNLTEEEQQILTGQSLINKDLYTEKKDFEIDAKKLLHNDELINIRKHTRFIDFPEHKHNYIEMAYILQGEMIQKIKGKEIRLKKGEIIFLNQHITHEIKASSKEDIIINFIIKPEFFEYILNLIDKENIISKFLFSTIYGGSRKGEYICFYVGNIKNVQNILKGTMKMEFGDMYMIDNLVCRGCHVSMSRVRVNRPDDGDPTSLYGEVSLAFQPAGMIVKNDLMRYLQPLK
jgi:mannose-6-phosphate isomerase-like protein (cupin superfamily)